MNELRGKEDSIRSYMKTFRGIQVLIYRVCAIDNLRTAGYASMIGKLPKPEKAGRELIIGWI
jgi:hypothetical protein